MKITESQLRSIIKQELKKVMLEAETDHAAELKKRIADFNASKKKKETKPSSDSSKSSSTSSSPSYKDMFDTLKGKEDSKDAAELKARIAASKKK